MSVLSSAVVKVQLSIASSEAQQMVLIYDKERSVMFEGVADKQVRRLMRDRMKAFFHADVLRNGTVVLKEEAEWQEW